MRSFVIALAFGCAVALQACAAEISPDQAKAASAMAQKIQARWKPDCAGGLSHRVKFSVGDDGQPLGPVEVLDPVDTDAWKASAAQARRAVTEAAPFDLPPGWRNTPIMLRLNPELACAAS